MPPTPSRRSPATAVDASTHRRLVEQAPAKVNLTLRVVARRLDGYHDIESLVVFAGVGDELTLLPGPRLDLAVCGIFAAASGAIADNLVLKAARALAAEVGGLTLGRFVLDKRLPVAAGLGGGSADAAAALRLLARANGLAPDDARLVAAARATGADVPVCLEPRPRLMRGIGDILSAPLPLPPLPAVLVNPGVALATKDVFTALKVPKSATADLGDRASFEARLRRAPQDDGTLWDALASNSNDLESAAIALQPVIADVLAALRALPGCRLARMSGSGATCFGLFESSDTATSAARVLAAAHPTWWVQPTTLAGASSPSPAGRGPG